MTMVATSTPTGATTASATAVSATAVADTTSVGSSSKQKEPEGKFVIVSFILRVDHVLII